MALTQKKTYFLSDIHLGAPNFEESLVREKKLVAWLETIRYQADSIYLLGDVFDFWHEWKSVAPQGFCRFLGKISEIADSGIPVHFFAGNHDMWVRNYLQRETGMIFHKGHLITEIQGKRFFLAHGDGLGPGDGFYKILKKIFISPITRFFFARILHPDFATFLATSTSRKSRKSSSSPKEYTFLGEDKEWLIIFAKEKLRKEYFDYFIFGHRHIPMELELSGGSRFFNLGDWITNFSYAVFDGENITLEKHI